MREVDRVIARRLDSGVPLVGSVSHYIISAGGKRLRPALLLLCCGALGYTGDQRFNMAAVVEFIHTATLLHDDVVDDSALRRGSATANARFGNPASVLVGDFLYSRAFQMMVDTQNMRIMEVLANSTNITLSDDNLLAEYVPLEKFKGVLEQRLAVGPDLVALLMRDGQIVGPVTSGSYGHFLGGAIGMGYVPCKGETEEEVLGSAYEIEVAGVRHRAVASVAPMQDPNRNG